MSVPEREVHPGRRVRVHRIIHDLPLPPDNVQSRHRTPKKCKGILFHLNKYSQFGPEGPWASAIWLSKRSARHNHTATSALYKKKSETHQNTQHSYGWGLQYTITAHAKCTFSSLQFISIKRSERSTPGQSVEGRVAKIVVAGRCGNVPEWQTRASVRHRWRITATLSMLCIVQLNLGCSSSYEGAPNQGPQDSCTSTESRKIIIVVDPRKRFAFASNSTWPVRRLNGSSWSNFSMWFTYPDLYLDVSQPHSSSCLIWGWHSRNRTS